MKGQYTADLWRHLLKRSKLKYWAKAYLLMSLMISFNSSHQFPKT